MHHVKGGAFDVFRQPDNAAEGAVEEEPELLDGAYRVISESTTGQILKPREAETNEPLSEEEIPEQFWPLLEAQGWQPPDTHECP